MMSSEDVETFVINEEVTEDIVDGINAFCDGSEDENEEEDFEDD